jgi:hypothetical protein
VYPGGDVYEVEFSQRDGNPVATVKAELASPCQLSPRVPRREGCGKFKAVKTFDKEA